ncbi:hypothetical protein CBA19CS91_40975 [Paraburkholderia hospita]|nr:hypothetical protein CBA19CS91_40975 [Paraburkholderia hospita]
MKNPLRERFEPHAANGRSGREEQRRNTTASRMKDALNKPVAAQ